MTAMTAPRSPRVPRAGAHDIAVLVAAVTVLVISGWDALDWPSALPYLFALVILSLMDIRLPHGDSVDVDSAVIIASVYLFGPAIAAWLVFISRILAHVALHGLSFSWSLAASISKRIVGISAGFAILWLVPSPSWERAQIFMEVLALGLAYVTAGLLYGQVSLAAERRDSILRMAASNIALQGPVLATGVSVGILTVLIHDGMAVWGLLLVLFLALTTRQSFALLLDVRQGYQATVEALIGAMEAQQSHELGVGSEVAIMARAAGAEYGWFGKSVENMGYAALLLHFGLSFTSWDDATTTARPTPLAEVQFLRPVAPIVEAAKNPPTKVSVTRRTLIAAYIVALCISRLSPARTDAMVASLAGQLMPKERWRSEAAVERAARKLGVS
ncbi:MAG: hypothetical protein IBX63_08270 [Coriobacteriia bacterium]|nr:hypothetical protein [Coriobacteriia bacterium]